MKIRPGFVSNSSSSSFIIGSKVALVEDSLYNILVQGNEKHPLDFLIRAFAKSIINNSKRQLIEEMKKDMMWDEDEVPETIRLTYAKFPYVYELRASNQDSDPISNMLYEFGDDFEVVAQDIEISNLWC